MPRFRRSKNNGKYFEVIPRPEESTEKVKDMTKQKFYEDEDNEEVAEDSEESEFKGKTFYARVIIDKNRQMLENIKQRTELVEQAREIRQQMYNISKENTEIQGELVGLLEKYDRAE